MPALSLGNSGRSGPVRASGEGDSQAAKGVGGKLIETMPEAAQMLDLLDEDFKALL